jgi:large subunit ribosomal protein L22
MEEQAGTRAVLRYCRMSAFKVRPVLDLIRGHDLEDAQDILRFSERDAARVVAKLLASAVANAENNDAQSADELYVSACYADEATTMKRWRPRARGRATRIRKRTSHITVVVTRVPDESLARRRERDTGDAASRRARRVAGARRQRVAASQAAEAEAAAAEEAGEDAGVAEGAEEAAPATDTRSDETGASGDAPPSEAALESAEEEAEGGADAESAAEAEAAEAEATAETEPAEEATEEPAEEAAAEVEEEEPKPRRRTRARREKRDE